MQMLVCPVASQHPVTLTQLVEFKQQTASPASVAPKGKVAERHGLMNALVLKQRNCASGLRFSPETERAVRGDGSPLPSHVCRYHIQILSPLN